MIQLGLALAYAAGLNIYLFVMWLNLSFMSWRIHYQFGNEYIFDCIGYTCGPNSDWFHLLMTIWLWLLKFENEFLLYDDLN